MGGFSRRFTGFTIYGQRNIRASLIIASLCTALGLGLLSSTSAQAVIGVSVLTIGSFTAIFRIAAGPFIMQNSNPEERPFVFSMNFALMVGAGFLGSLVRGFTRDFLAVFLHNDVLAYWIALFGFGSGLTIPFINLYFKFEWGLSDSLIGTWFGLAQLATFIGMILSPLLVRRFHIVRVIVWSQLASIPFMLIMGYVDLFPVVVFAFLLRQVLMNMHNPMNTQFRMKLVAPEEQSLINALRMIGFIGVRALAAFFGGRIIDHYSFSLSFTLTSAFYFIAAVLFFAFFHNVNISTKANDSGPAA